MTFNQDQASPQYSPDAVVQTLLDIAREMELEAQLRRARAWMHQITGASLSFVFSPEDDRFIPLAASIPGEDPRYRQVRIIDPGWLRAAQQPDFIIDEPEFGGLQPLGESWAGFEASNSWIVPLATAEDELAGIIWLIFENPPSKQQKQTATYFAEQMKPALDNAMRVRAMRDLVIKDDLARCFNRRYFEEFLPEELERSARFRAPLSLIFFDMDNLKSINNQYGHSMGSRSLFEISVRVRDRIRKFDKLFRFGGDEFCIVLPETDWRGAVEVAERVRGSLEVEPFLVGQIDDPDGVKITASFGISSYPLHARTKEALVRGADKAMQDIKGLEKNAVGVARPVKEQSG